MSQNKAKSNAKREAYAKKQEAEGNKVIMWIIGNTVSGWSSLIVSIWALGGLQLLAIGVVGEYIGKIYMESKHRPRFIVEEQLK